jgi:hypothetical protein
MPTTTTKRTSPAPQATKTPVTRQPQRPALNETQELIIDAVSEMLAHGGHEDDVEMLIEAAMRHLEHRQLDYLFNDKPEERQRIMERRINEGFNGWKTDLAIAWHANKRKEFPETAAKTVSEQIRAFGREVLNDRLEEFLRDATPEETRLLSEVLNSRNNGPIDRIKGSEEILLGMAFEFELGQNETYIRIPRGFRERTQKYIDALRAVEDKAA